MSEGLGRVLEVLDPGALSTLQDAGRPGFAHLGVPLCGALDQPAFRLANRLVGNPEDAAVVETTYSGIEVRFAAAATLAVAGARCVVDLGGRMGAWGAPVSVRAGTRVRLGPALDGMRSYLAVGGGLEAERTLGSVSTDLLSGIGPAPLRAGDRIGIGPLVAGPIEAEAVGERAPAVLRVNLGPRADWFTARALAELDGSRYTVGPDSNRIGLRLHGPPVIRSTGDELPSEPMVLGAIQVTAAGQPVVFLRDHPTTGGYPVVGVVVESDLPVCAQARPGEQITLRVRH